MYLIIHFILYFQIDLICYPAWYDAACLGSSAVIRVKCKLLNINYLINFHSKPGLLQSQ